VADGVGLDARRPGARRRHGQGERWLHSLSCLSGGTVDVWRPPSGRRARRSRRRQRIG
jgi:hypothetical protein